MIKRLFLIWITVIFPLASYGQGGVMTSDETWRSNTSDEERDPDEDQKSAWLLTPLSAYDAPFTSLSRYNFSFTRYARRGYDWNFSNISLNGIDLSNPISGHLFWSIVTAIQQTPSETAISEGITPGTSLVGGLGGAREYRLDALQEPLRTRVGWMFTDRRFRMGLRVSSTSGVLPGGWALLATATRRWGYDQHIRGVYADDWTLAVSLAKKFGKRHTLSGALLLAPSEQGTRSAATAEAFALTGDPLYNPAWGYQQGRTRSSRVRTNNLPMAFITWNFQPNSRWQITSSLSGLWGTTARSMLDWYDAQNPQPDYYRYLPSHYDNPTVSHEVREAWKNQDPKITQINWEELTRSNQDSLSAAYVLGSTVEQYRNFQWVSHFIYQSSHLLQLRGGVRFRMDRTTAFNRLDDLLGASFLRDIDPYLIDDQYFGDKLQNDLRHPNRQVQVGERYGHSYDLDYMAYEGWLVADLRNRHDERFGGYLALQVTQVEFSRTGHYEKELFPGSASYGGSARQRFTPYTLKGGISYLFTPAHTLSMELFYGDAAPAAREIFVSPEYRNRIIDTPRPVNQLGGELCYRYTGRVLQLELRGYITSTRGASDVRSYYDDLASVYSDLLLSDMNRRYAGVELGANLMLTQRFKLRLAAAQGWNSYQNNPTVQILSNKDGREIVAPTHTYLKGFRLSGSPQRVASAEISYQAVRLWMASLSVNYTANNYVSPSPLNRMQRIYNYATSPEDLRALTSQERFPEAFTINLFASKSFRIGESYYLSISGSVNNLINRKHIIYSGYEQMRLRKSGTGLNQSITTFGSKYLYAYPRTYYLSINFRF